MPNSRDSKTARHDRSRQGKAASTGGLALPEIVRGSLSRLSVGKYGTMAATLAMAGRGS